MILLTGAAGFIGFHTAQALLSQGERIIGIDNLNDYYNPSLKKARLEQLENQSGFTFHKVDIADKEAVTNVTAEHKDITKIIHLAAQAGVRYSLEQPNAYAESNLTGHLNMLEAARHCERLEHFVYASSSSVYGGNTKQPFAIEDAVDCPVSLYAATKRSGELIAQSYAHLYGIPATGLRFFTVYGPWGRPDMAYFSFTKNIAEGKPITLFNGGDMKRDFTWIDDVVQGVLGALGMPPSVDDPYTLHGAPHRLFNLGNNNAESLTDFVAAIEEALGKAAEILFAPMEPGDVQATWADITASEAVFGYNPCTPIAEGIPRFVEWYKGFYEE